MRNQLVSELDVGRDAAFEPVVNPRRRLTILAVAMLACLTVVGARVAHVQTVLANRFLEPWNTLQVQEEPIPARDGRILSRDGVVLAGDETRYDVMLDYRWLQSPSDAGWLRKMAMRELSPGDRRDAQKRSAAERAVLARRERLLANLASAAGIEQHELTQRLESIQRRIESMAESVERRRQERAASQRLPPIDLSSDWRTIAQSVIQELTTPPDRFTDDPIVLKEELQGHVVVQNASLETIGTIQSLPTQFPGVRIQSSTVRSYPREGLAAHLIGVRQRVGNQADQARIGRSGIEKSQDAALHGTPGTLQRWVELRGEEVRSEIALAPEDGHDVTLTIDARLQEIAESLLDEAIESPNEVATPQGACLIAIDIWTGDLITMASAPRPQLGVVAAPTQEEWKELLADSRRPLFPRATQMALPGGSVFKLVTAAAALESGVATPDDLFFCQGYLEQADQYRCLTYRRHGVGHGDVQLDEALCQSCNVYFLEMARRMGPDALEDWARRFGFGARTGVDLPGERAGQLPELSGTPRSESARLRSAMQLSIGQGNMLMTPLQAVRMTASIANGGYLVTPRVVLKTAPRAGAPSFINEPVLEKIPGLSDATLAVIREGMRMTVHDPRGTGRAALVELMTLAGKTGTAETGDRPDHAWFVGYAPAESPRLAFVVVLEHGGSGAACGPIVRDFITEALGEGYLSPDVTRFEPDETLRRPFDQFSSVRQTEDAPVEQATESGQTLADSLR